MRLQYMILFFVIVIPFFGCKNVNWDLPKIETRIKTTLPEVTTSNVTIISKKSATLGGSIVNSGGTPIIESGIVFSDIPNPSLGRYINYRKGSDTGIFSYLIPDLLPGNFYYARAFASNINGTAYGGEVTFKMPIHDIGDSYGGGIIFYVDSTGGHGLISSLSDQSIAAPWDPISFPTVSCDAYDSAIGSGKLNTAKICNKLATLNNAARICSNYRGGGFSDWFLPSLLELRQMYIHKHKIGNLSDEYYWSSTEYWSIQRNSAFQFSFLHPGGHIQNPKFITQRVRAIRIF